MASKSIRLGRYESPARDGLCSGCPNELESNLGACQRLDMCAGAHIRLVPRSKGGRCHVCNRIEQGRDMVFFRGRQQQTTAICVPCIRFCLEGVPDGGQPRLFPGSRARLTRPLASTWCAIHRRPVDAVPAITTSQGSAGTGRFCFDGLAFLARLAVRAGLLQMRIPKLQACHESAAAVERLIQSGMP